MFWLVFNNEILSPKDLGVEDLSVCKETGYEIFQYAGTSISLELTRGVDNSWCEVNVKGAPQPPNPLIITSI